MSSEKAKQYQLISDDVLADPLFNVGLGTALVSGVVSKFVEETPETKVLSGTILMAGGAIMATSYLINRFTSNNEKWIEKIEEKAENNKDLLR